MGAAAPVPDLFSLGTPVSTSYTAPPTVLLTAEKGKGLAVAASFARRQANMYMDITLTNKSMMPMSTFAIQFNKNSFGLVPAGPLTVPGPVFPGASATVNLQLNNSGPVMKVDPLLKIQMAMKNDIDVFYFECHVPAYILFTETGAMERKLFLDTWRNIPDQKEVQSTLAPTMKSPEQIEALLTNNNVFVVATRPGGDGGHNLYLSVKFTNGIWVLGELRLVQGVAPVLALKTQQLDAVIPVQTALSVLVASE